MNFPKNSPSYKLDSPPELALLSFTGFLVLLLIPSNASAALSGRHQSQQLCSILSFVILG